MQLISLHIIRLANIETFLCRKLSTLILIIILVESLRYGQLSIVARKGSGSIRGELLLRDLIGADVRWGQACT
jgi:hypothetical protein